MQSTPQAPSRTLASLLDTEKTFPAARARTLLAQLSEATSVPPTPPTPLGWLEIILVSSPIGAPERAAFREIRSSSTAFDPESRLARQLDALRVAATSMLWGTAAVSDEATQATGESETKSAKYPRLRALFTDQWDEARKNCKSADRFMMFFDATLALDKAAEPKVGRDPFMTLGMQTTGPMKKGGVGTIGVGFEAITDTGKFRRANVAPPPPEPPAAPPEAETKSPIMMYVVAIVVVIAAVIGYRFLSR